MWVIYLFLIWNQNVTLSAFHRFKKWEMDMQTHTHAATQFYHKRNFSISFSWFFTVFFGISNNYCIVFLMKNDLCTLPSQQRHNKQMWKAVFILFFQFFFFFFTSKLIGGEVQESFLVVSLLWRKSAGIISHCVYTIY
jgi:hypothetical protein